MGKAVASGGGEVHRMDKFGRKRHPVYLGLRSDKRAEDVTREREKLGHGKKAGK